LNSPSSAPAATRKRGDPLAELELDEADFGWVTAEIRQIEARAGGGRVVSAFEGGYDLNAHATVRRRCACSDGGLNGGKTQ